MPLTLDTIICGDNAAVMATFPDACIDLTVTSPPYDELRRYNSSKPMSELWDFEAIAQQLWRVTKPGGVVVWVVADATVNGSETGTSFRQALRFMEIGFRLHDTMIWDKGGFSAVGSTAVRYGPVFEFMLVLSKDKPAVFNPINDRPNAIPNRTIHGTIKDANGIARPVCNIGKRMGTHGIRFNIWPIPADKESPHPAPFPESLARDHILSWSNEGGVVLDPFCGSGTTPKMARAMGRHWVGIEINPDYVEICRKRLAQQVFEFSA